MAEGVLQLTAAGASSLDSWSENARRAAIANSWRSRATRILETLDIHG